LINLAESGELKHSRNAINVLTNKLIGCTDAHNNRSRSLEQMYSRTWI